MNLTWTLYTLLNAFLLLIFTIPILTLAQNKNKDLVQPGEEHLEGVPVFIQQPEPLYYVRQKGLPVVVSCVAEPVSHASIRCADTNYPYKDFTDSDSMDKTPRGLEVVKLNSRGLPDPSGTRWKMSLKVMYENVEEWFGKYLCYCEAWNKVTQLNMPKKVHSRNTTVKEAYFERNFNLVPMDINQEVNRHLMLSCRAPKAEPKATIHWLKDKVRITRSKFPHVLINDYNQLIIHEPRPKDSGNYTCVATSLDVERRSPPGKVNIYVNGMWSSWKVASECPAGCEASHVCRKKCLIGIQKRNRQCNNPRPVNGGAKCQGESVETLSCSSVCKINGGWTKWSEWSKCGSGCRQERLRHCTNPVPRRGGHSCFGDAVQNRNCSGVECSFLSNAALFSENFSPAAKAAEKGLIPRDIAMYVGLFIAFVILLTAIVVIVFLVRRRNLGPGGSGLRYSVHANGNGVCGQQKEEKKLHKLLIPPDLTQTVVTIKNPNAVDIHQPTSPAASLASTLPSSCSGPYTGMRFIPPSNTTYMSIDNKPPTSGKTSRRGQPVPIAPAPPPPPPPLPSSTHPTFLSPTSGVVGKSRPSSALYHELSLGRETSGVLANFIPASLDVDSVAWGIFTSAGGRLCLPASGVSLTIPQGALAHGVSEEIFLAVCRDEKDRPVLTEQQTLLSPVILCGPPHVQLLKSPILTMPHAANLTHGGWLMRILVSTSTVEEEICWQELMTVGRENLNTPAYCQLDQTSVHLMTDQLHRFCLAGESSTTSGGHAHKNLRLAAFSSPLSASLDCNIRVYVVVDTRDAFEHVVAMETSRLSGRLLDSTKQLVYKDGGCNLCFCIEELSIGWRSRNKFQEIPFQHIWSGNMSSVLHCEFTLEHIDPTRQNVSCKIVAYQDTFYSNRQILQIVSDKNESSTGHGAMQTSNHRASVGNDNGVHLDPLQSVFRIPLHVRQRMCTLLDPPNVRGNDWRMLARQLGVDRYINYFATKPSPTDSILDLWEARNREETASADLRNALRAMGRPEVATLLENEAVAAWL